MPHASGFSLAAVPLLIALNAFFVVGEYAVVAARPVQLQSLRARGAAFARAAAAMERLRADPTGTIGAIQVCITMTNLMLGWIGEPAMNALLHRVMGPLVDAYPKFFDPFSTALSFIVVTLLTVVFSELLPKVLTLRYVVPAIMLTAPPLLLVKGVTFPLVWLMNRTANAVTRPLGLGRVDDAEESEAVGRVTAEELRLLAEQLAAEGTVSPRQRSLVLNALAMGRRTARQIMVPRVHVTYLDLRRSMEANLRVIEGNLFSRLPLCDGGMDRVIGIVHTYRRVHREAYPNAVRRRRVRRRRGPDHAARRRRRAVRRRRKPAALEVRITRPTRPSRHGLPITRMMPLLNTSLPYASPPQQT